MIDVAEAAEWLKRERTRLGWSATETARQAREVAKQFGDPIRLSQQAVSQFENERAKSVPRWIRYVRFAVLLQMYPPEKRREKLWELAQLETGGGTWDELNEVADGLTWEARADAAKVIRAIVRGTHRLIPKTEGALPAPTAESIADQLDAALVPQVEIGLSMGGGSVLEDWPVIQMVPMSRAWLRSLTPSPASELMVARGDGDSMMPTILDGDLVIIDRAQQTPRQQDRIWALAYGGWGMVKRLRALPDGSLQINSDNPAVSPISAVEGEALIIGRVVGVVRRI